MESIPENMKEPNFLCKVLDATADLVGCYFFLCASMGRPCQNLICCLGLYGGFIAACIMAAAHLKEQKSEFYETALLAVYGALNLFSAYIFYSKTAGGCQCGGKFDPNMMIAVCCTVAGGSMLSEVVMKNMEKGESGGDGGEQ